MQTESFRQSVRNYVRDTRRGFAILAKEHVNHSKEYDLFDPNITLNTLPVARDTLVSLSSMGGLLLGITTGLLLEGATHNNIPVPIVAIPMVLGLALGTSIVPAYLGRQKRLGNLE